MMKIFALTDIEQVTNGKVHFGACSFDRVSTDTRTLQAGDLFVALLGDNFDAHDFLADVENKKAAGVVVSRLCNDVDLPQLLVENTTDALGSIAKFNRDHFTGPVVGITGSCGKTTVKTMLKNILEQASSKQEVLATQGNFNNHIGVPLTLFNINKEHKYAVVEMGASGPSEIKYLSGISKPDVVVVTNALQAHVEGFGSVEGVVKAKGELFENLKKGGTAVVNRDDAAFDQWMGMLEKNPSSGLKIVTFSTTDRPPEGLNNDVFESHSDFHAVGISEGPKGNVDFVMNMPGDEVAIRLQLLGAQNVSNALAAAACAYSIGISSVDIKKGLEATSPVAGRMQPVKGKNNSLIIDDSYNANPDSVKAAIDALSRWEANTFLVLGDLGELGKNEKALHEELGIYAKEKNIQHLITVGDLTKATHRSYGAGAVHCADHDEIIKILNAMLDDRSVVLVKGSRVSKMDKVVAALKNVGEN